MSDDIDFVRTSVLLRHVDPFARCWGDLDRSIVLSDVTRALRAKSLHLAPPRTEMAHDHLTLSQRTDRRREHVSKIAWFVRNGFDQPLDVDVGVPWLGAHVAHIVQDGNHRFAAAVYRHRTMGEDPILPLEVSGDVQLAKDMGLKQAKARRARKRPTRSQIDKG